MQVQQNRALRIRHDKYFKKPTRQLHEDVDHLMVKTYTIAACTNHTQTKTKPTIIFQNYFRINTDVHQHNTRNSNKLFIERNRSEQGKLMLIHMGSTTWNHLPDSRLKSVYKNKM